MTRTQSSASELLEDAGTPTLRESAVIPVVSKLHLPQRTAQPQVDLNRRLRVCVGVQDEGLNGIETYAEQVAIAAANAGHDVTLVVTTDDIAHKVRARVRPLAVNVVSLSIPPISKSTLLAERLVPQLQTKRVGDAFARMLREAPVSYEIIHLNRPALAPGAEGRGAAVFVAGWFFPHSPTQRLSETWAHTQGGLPRRLVLALKSLAYYAGDVRGYRSTTVVACTETLAAQLRSQGLKAVACPPPAASSSKVDPVAQVQGELRLLVCSGDLSHPRKNVRDAIRAVAELARRGARVHLRVIGKNADALKADASGLPASARVEFLGTKSPLEVREEMRKAHALLLPSRYEEWGYVAVESTLSGTPVVSYPVYPFADMLKGGLGVVAEAMTPEALATAIQQSVSLPRGWQLANAAEKRFGAAVVGSKLTQVWNEGLNAMVTESPAPAPAVSLF